MIRILLIFLFLPFWGFSTEIDYYLLAATESDPAAIIDGSINAITGDFIIQQADIEVVGAEPLSFRKSYLSRRPKRSKWDFSIPFYAYSNWMRIPIERPKAKEAYEYEQTLSIKEPTGTTLHYFSYREFRDEKTKKLPIYFYLLPSTLEAAISNSSRGEIGGRFHIKNNRVEMDYNGKKFTLYTSAGGKRIYRKIHDENQKGNDSKDFFYLLDHEYLPNGNRVEYSYNDWPEVTDIKSTDPNAKYIYAWIHFEYLHDNTIQITTSDNQELYYHRDQDKLLRKATLPEKPDESFSYHANSHLIECRFLPNQRITKVDYYLSGENHESVKSVSVYDEDGSFHPLWHLQYEPAELFKKGGKTILSDAEGNQTIYHYSPTLKLEMLEYYQKVGEEQKLSHQELFSWGDSGSQEAGCLLARSFVDDKGLPIFSRRFFYDKYGNITRECFYGNLSGNSPPLVLEKNLPIASCECYTIERGFTEDGRNLLSWEKEGDLLTQYFYQSHTDKLIAKISTSHEIHLRTFYIYNAQGILIEEIEDDGTAHDLHDLSRVTQRKITRITPKKEQPFYGMAEIVEEGFFDLPSNSFQLLKKTHLHYSSKGEIIQKDVYDASGNFAYSTEHKYDDKRRLIYEKEAINSATYSYDENNNLLEEKLLDIDLTKQHLYDRRNRRVKLIEIAPEESQISLYRYDERNRLIEMTDYLGLRSSYEYNAFGHRTKTIYPAYIRHDGSSLNPAEESLVDASGNITHQIDPNGHTTQTYYNAYRKPIRIIHPDETEELFCYYLNGELHSHTNQRKTRTVYTYDALRRMTSKRVFSSSGELSLHERKNYSSFHLISEEDAEGFVTYYSYDGAGRLIEKRREGYIEQYSYDPLGRLHKVEKGPFYQEFSYDLQDRLIQTKEYDEGDHLLFQEDYAYDALGNQTETIKYINNEPQSEKTLYDAFSRPYRIINPFNYQTDFIYERSPYLKITEIDPHGIKTTTSYNAQHQISCIIMENTVGHLLQKEERFYDPNGNLTHQIYLNEWSGLLEITQEYDTLDRPTCVTEAANHTSKKTFYSYTAVGELATITKPDGITLTNDYDALGRRRALYSSDGSISYIYCYDRLGRLMSSLDQINQQHLTRKLDHQGNILTEELSTGLILQNSYDPLGRRVQLILPNSSSILYNYHGAYLASVTRKNREGHTLYSHLYQEYDLARNPIKEESIFSEETTTSFDPLGRKSHLKSPHFQQSVESLDAKARVLSVSTLSSKSYKTNYAYDDLDQLISEKALSESYFSPTLFFHEYQHDSLYNRRSKNQVTYEISGLNELVKAGDISYTYDLNGNPIQEESPNQKALFTYDALDRLITYEIPEKLLVTYNYDSFHRRYAKTLFSFSSGEWTKDREIYYLYDDQNEIGSLDEEGNFAELRILGRTPHAEIGAAIALEINQTLYAPIHDLFGNLTALVANNYDSYFSYETSPHLIEEYTLTAFGEEEGSSPISPWRFSSKRTDPESSLVYFGRRYYCPLQGRFLTPDPNGFGDGPNLYTYVHNNPLYRIDEYGLEEFRSIWDDLEKMNQACLGILHGASGFARETISGMYTLGFYAASPVLSLTHGGFSNAYQTHQNHLSSFERAWNQTTGSLFSGADFSSSTFQSFRSGTSLALTAASLATPGNFAKAESLLKFSGSVLKNTALKTKNIKLPKKIWTSTKQRSSVKNAFLHWKEHGADFSELLNAKQYATSAKSFINNPPTGTLTKVRANGDIVFYNPLTNSFAISNAEKLPRTFYKPSLNRHPYSTSLEYFNAQK